MRAFVERLADEARALSAGRHRVESAVSARTAACSAAPKELHSAFSNLVSNAVRYTPAGGTVRARLALDDGRGVFRVSDTGIGIEARHIPRLTERFYRVDSGRSRESGGTGLGLAIVKHALTRHQAVLDVTSELGTRLDLQRRVSAEPRARRRGEEAGRGLGGGSGGLVGDALEVGAALDHLGQPHVVLGLSLKISSTRLGLYQPAGSTSVVG